VQLLLDQAPPQLSVNVPWRELYVGGAAHDPRYEVRLAVRGAGALEGFTRT
jgi:hypothetical protein